MQGAVEGISRFLLHSLGYQTKNIIGCPFALEIMAHTFAVPPSLT